MRISVINGPNMNMLGIREPHIYGSVTLEVIEAGLRELADELAVELECFQSNHEGAIVDYIHRCWGTMDGMILNPSAFSKTGYSILDAIGAIDVPYIEVHMSNVFSRGGWHAESIFFEKAAGHIIGLQCNIYELALRGMKKHLEERVTQLKRA